MGTLHYYKVLMSLYPLCLRYDEELGVVYMAARLAGGYSAVRRALNEVPEKKFIVHLIHISWVQIPRCSTFNSVYFLN